MGWGGCETEDGNWNRKRPYQSEKKYIEVEQCGMLHPTIPNRACILPKDHDGKHKTSGSKESNWKVSLF